eukprot:2608552-Prymnesium_polylepis.1
MTDECYRRPITDGASCGPRTLWRARGPIIGAEHSNDSYPSWAQKIWPMAYGAPCGGIGRYARPA